LPNNRFNRRYTLSSSSTGTGEALGRLWDCLQVGDRLLTAYARKVVQRITRRQVLISISTGTRVPLNIKAPFITLGLRETTSSLWTAKTSFASHRSYIS
jgi:hypothetical protein